MAALRAMRSAAWIAPASAWRHAGQEGPQRTCSRGGRSRHYLQLDGPHLLPGHMLLGTRSYQGNVATTAKRIETRAVPGAVETGLAPGVLVARQAALARAARADGQPARTAQAPAKALALVRAAAAEAC
jgi:hypothetical protein